MARGERLRLKKEPGRYHHGSLREALVRAAERAIERSGHVDLPLRELARLAGVSHAAAYRHFDSKAALLAEVAIRGFVALRAALEAGASRSSTPKGRLVEAGVGYVAFALEHRGSFGVMFDRSLKPFTKFPGLAEAAFEALSVLHGLVREGIAAGVLRPDDVNASAMALWALVHGQAVLLLEDQLAGPFEVGAEDGPAAAKVALRRLIDGLRAR